MKRTKTIEMNLVEVKDKPIETQQWTKPQLVFQKPGYILWYPSLQPLDTEEDIKVRRTSLKLGKRARFFVKRIKPGDDEYASEHIIEFEK